MTEKRFTFADGFKIVAIKDNDKIMNSKQVCNKLNELHEEKEKWKHSCLKTVSENSILWNEISILREQGAEPSSAFQQYLDSISTEYDKFWQRKLKKAKKDNVIE